VNWQFAVRAVLKVTTDQLSELATRHALSTKSYDGSVYENTLLPPDFFPPLLESTRIVRKMCALSREKDFFESESFISLLTISDLRSSESQPKQQ
jgi:hypothetical protein